MNYRTPSETEWRYGATRRRALQALAGFLGGSPLLRAQQDPFRDHSRVPALNELRTVFDFEPVAYAKLPFETYHFTMMGVEDEWTLRRNRQAFDWVELIPKGVANVSSIETATEILGTKMAFPLMVAPSSGQGALHPLGELGMHQGASGASNTPMICGGGTSTAFEKVVAGGTSPMWLQLYARDGAEANREAIERAQDLGLKAVALTVDVSMASQRERVLHSRHLGGGASQLADRRARAARAAAPGTEAPGARRVVRGGAGAGGGGGALPTTPYGAVGQTPWVDWKLVAGLKSFMKIPLVTKGILNPLDAKLCIENGVDAIIVSNHGGRYLEYAPSTLEVLPEIIDAVGGRIPVITDSGYRRGSDVLKALAIGAKAVCLGRAARWGLAAYGPAGVQRVFEIVQAELLMAMAATGCSSLASLDRSLVKTDFP